MLTEVCIEPGCIAYVERRGDFCDIHRQAKRVKLVMEGEKCLRCRGPIRKGEWVTRESQPMTMKHAKCPPPKEGSHG